MTAEPIDNERAGDGGTLARRCFARRGAALDKEITARRDEQQYWAAVLREVSDGRRFRGLTPEERFGLRLAHEMLKGDRSIAEVRKAVERRAGSHRG